MNRTEVSGRPGGLREQKKQETRERIAATARALFQQHGYDSITVARVAVAAGVSEATVFNYFPTKDELFFGGGLEEFEGRTLAAVRDRRAGESVIAAFRRFTLQNIRHAADPKATELIVTAARIVAGSPTLQARERELVATTTDSLAALLRTEDVGRLEAWVIANALIGVQRAIVAEVRAEVLAGRHGAALTNRVRRQAERALNHLESGLA
ncbi:TetR/AcrR family transcriptional regulator [Kribbella sp. VKM Ac-2568]|uniref:TetR/AcrR family transcriptional regulator n=1 Tax=Kribbella sp. VKM Ac-2568 TaxID=2512219 RepID=UPI0010429DE7|nr:TetR/AcrR family transcriptional regulator [Kribbella sp. VKM Ac-2568]TCM46074.1 TetR family transcriptional regulator [Kribbella sp. VKM Ac-2568]